MDSTFKVRIRAINDNDTWSEAATWQSITDGWNNLEIDYLAADLSGRLVLRLAGATLQSLSNLDTGSVSIDSVRLGTMGVETGTRGAVFFDDYQSRRFSLIGPLPDPGLQDPQVTPVVDWINKAYTYGDDAHKHAVAIYAHPNRAAASGAPLWSSPTRRKTRPPTLTCMMTMVAIFAPPSREAARGEI